MNFQNSYCKSGYLHKFMTISSTPDAVLERCVKPHCGKRHVIKLWKGEPHIVDYARFHMREMLVKQHRLFNREFPSYEK